MYLFKIKDKNNRIIHLSKERWNHITKEHPEIKDIDKIKETLTNAHIIKKSFYDKNVRWFYLYNKNIKRYLIVAVKYLNGKGFIITAFHTRKIK